MISLTPDQFKRKIAENQTALEALQNKRLPEIIGCIALKRFEESFQRESSERL
jgi:hypothetical protein